MTGTLLDASMVDPSIDLADRVKAIEQKIDAKENSLAMVVFSNELDKLLAAFTIATGAAASGMTVNMFFTFWATSALKKRGPQATGKTLMERMFGWMLPAGFARQKLSKFNLFGIGRWMIAREMVNKNVANLEQLFEAANELGVDIKICEMSMSLMGIRPEELADFDRVEYCGVATFLQYSSSSSTTLFI